MSWTYLGDTKPKARKQYHCELCNRPIAKGDVHAKRSGVCDNELVGCRYHVECLEYADETFDRDMWEGYDPDEFRKELAAHRLAQVLKMKEAI